LARCIRIRTWKAPWITPTAAAAAGMQRGKLPGLFKGTG
jgi:hypothetical protein